MSGGSCYFELNSLCAITPQLSIWEKPINSPVNTVKFARLIRGGPGIPDPGSILSLPSYQSIILFYNRDVHTPFSKRRGDSKHEEEK